MSPRALPLLLLVLAGCSPPPAAQAPPLPTVNIARPERMTVKEYRDFTGTIRAYEFAEIRARVTGTLEEMLFEPSADVAAQDTLFVIEPETYQAAVNEAVAEHASALSQLASAKSDLDRIEKAIQSDAVSQQDLTRALAARDQAQAAVLAAEARMDDAKLQLEYTQVRTPIAGQVSRNFVDLGNLVGVGEPTLLTTVTRVQPIYCYFNVPERGVLRYLSDPKSMPRERVPVGVATDLDEGFPHRGHIDYVDNTVDPHTGTIEVRAVLPNEERMLFPGLFVRVRVFGYDKPDAVVIHERAVGTDLGGKYVLLVGDDNVVEQRRVVLGSRQADSKIVVEEGLDGTERYIIEGLLRARVGLPVQPELEEE